MSQQKNNWPGLFCSVHCYVLHNAKAVAARIPIHGSASSTYVSCRLYVHTIFLNTWYNMYMVEFACGFPGYVGLVLIPYYCSIKLILNL